MYVRQRECGAWGGGDSRAESAPLPPGTPPRGTPQRSVHRDRSAPAALAGLNGTKLGGRALRVKEPRQREERREPRRPRWEGRQAGQTEDTPAAVLAPTARLRSPADARGGSPAKARMARVT